MRIELVFAKPTVGGKLLVDPGVKYNWSTHDLDTLPQWIQERIAVIRLLDAAEVSPLGAWYSPLNYTPAREEVQAVFAIVRLPGDPKWEE